MIHSLIYGRRQLQALVRPRPHARSTFIQHESSAIGNHIGMTCIESPSATFPPPDIREAPVRRLPCSEPSAGRVAERHESLKTHDEGEVAIYADELNLSLE